MERFARQHAISSLLHEDTILAVRSYLERPSVVDEPPTLIFRSSVAAQRFEFFVRQEHRYPFTNRSFRDDSITSSSYSTEIYDDVLEHLGVGFEVPGGRST